MRAGRLDRKITIQRKTQAPSNTGEMVDTWTTIALRRSASMDPLNADERFSDPQFVSTEQLQFRVHYSADVANVSPLDRIIYPALDSDGTPLQRRIFDVMSVYEIGRREGLKIIAFRRPDLLVDEVQAATFALLLESGDFLLLESGGKLLLE